MRPIAAAGFRWQAQSKMPLLSGQIGCLFFGPFFGSSCRRNVCTKQPCSACPCFGRIRRKYVMKRDFRATFRRAENKETGKIEIKGRRMCQQKTGRSLEILLMWRGTERMFHVKHSQKVYILLFSQNTLNSFPSAYLFLHIKKVINNSS